MVGRWLGRRLARRRYRGGRDRRRGDREQRLWLCRLRGLRRLWRVRRLCRLRRLWLRRGLRWLWLFGLCAAALALRDGLLLRLRPGLLRICPGLFGLRVGLLRAPAVHRLWRLPRLRRRLRQRLRATSRPCGPLRRSPLSISDGSPVVPAAGRHAVAAMTKGNAMTSKQVSSGINRRALLAG